MKPLAPPRWKNGPGICESANLPGFLTTDDLAEFVESVCGSVAVKWLCAECGTWHFWPSCGHKPTGRSYPIPERIIELIQKTKVST